MRSAAALDSIEVRARLGGLGCAVLALLIGSGCASQITRRDSTYVHERHGYAIGVPDGRWTRVSVEGAVLAFRGPDGALMSMMSRCRETAAPPALLARQLLIGLEERTLRQAGPVLIEGRSGWGQTLDARQDGGSVRVRTITVVAGDCVVDWVLVSSGPFESVEGSFDAWWSTFRAGDAESSRAGASR